jgi:hypothetical protein
VDPRWTLKRWSRVAIAESANVLKQHSEELGLIVGVYATASPGSGSAADGDQGCRAWVRWLWVRGYCAARIAVVD